MLSIKGFAGGAVMGGRNHPNFVEQLARLVELTPEPRISIDWNLVEQRVGRCLPSDYKEFAERFGPGHFGEYIWVAVPRGDAPRVNLFNELRETADLWEFLGAEQIAIEYPLYPAKNGLIPWGSTLDGQPLYWRTESNEPDDWTVLVDLMRGEGRWFEFTGSMTHFLYCILTGRIFLPVLPDGFASERHGFIRFSPGPELQQ